jgi:DNA-cytosine methyltransferase
MITLSCFDGMSCGQLAFERAGIPIEKYYASEIDKYAIKVTMANYPDTVQLGSITEWQSWNIEQPDIIIGGSPCQGFSFAGKQLNFEDERSKLFFTFVDILKHYKPKYFLLENVVMKKEYNDVISSILGEIYPECVEQTELFRTGRLEPIQINSALVSAQNRNRLYWTNIQGIEQPKDRGILLKDIIDNSPDKSAYYSDKAINGFKNRKENQLEKGNGHGHSEININGKSNPILSRDYKDGKSNIITGGAFRGRNPKSNALTSVSKDSIVVELCHENKSGTKTIHTKKSCALRANASANYQTIKKELTWRKLTPIECERLQTVPDNYTNHVSNSQRYKMLGNGWTVDVISHLFGGLK